MLKFIGAVVVMTSAMLFVVNYVVTDYEDTGALGKRITAIAEAQYSDMREQEAMNNEG
jgi:hypothetical protein